MKVYEQITARIIELLETGPVPWKKPWLSSEGPMNLVSKKPYRGINSFLLNCSPYSSPYWMTYKQAAEKGGQVRRGAKSTAIVFWKWLDCKADPDGDDSEATGKVPLVRYYNVFNLEQIDGIKPPSVEQPANPFTPIEQAEQVIKDMPQRPLIEFGGNRACYSPTLDHISFHTRKRSGRRKSSTAQHSMSLFIAQATQVGWVVKAYLSPAFSAAMTTRRRNWPLSLELPCSAAMPVLSSKQLRTVLPTSRVG